MTGTEVFALVTEKKKRIEDLLDPTTFTLNTEIVELEHEIEELQNKCPHDYDETDTCQYCGHSKN